MATPTKLKVLRIAAVILLSSLALGTALTGMARAQTEPFVEIASFFNLSMNESDCYEVTFLEMVANGDGTSTWRYMVEELPCAQDLSYWVLELPSCAMVVDAYPSPWESVSPDPNLDLSGIKWQTGADFTSGEFTVTLSGDLTTGMTRAGIKGPGTALFDVTGPACEMSTATSTPTETPTPTETLTPTATFTPTGTLAPTNPPTITATEPAEYWMNVVSDNGQSLTIQCSGGAVMVTGNSNTLTLLGACSSLIVRGNANQITLEAYTMVTDTGNGNMIFMPPPPSEMDEPPAETTELPPTSSGPIYVTSNDSTRTIACGGAAVTVQGNNNTLTLTGACSSLTVLGNNNYITLQSPTVVIDKGAGNIIQ